MCSSSSRLPMDWTQFAASPHKTSQEQPCKYSLACSKSNQRHSTAIDNVARDKPCRTGTRIQQLLRQRSMWLSNRIDLKPVKQVLCFSHAAHQSPRSSTPKLRCPRDKPPHSPKLKGAEQRHAICPKKDCKELVLKYISSIFHSICWCAYEKDQIHILITPKPRKKAESRWNAPQASQVCQGHSRPHSVHHPLSAWSWITAWFAWDALPNMQQRSLTWDQRLFTQFSWQRMATQK